MAFILGGEGGGVREGVRNLRTLPPDLRTGMQYLVRHFLHASLGSREKLSEGRNRVPSESVRVLVILSHINLRLII